MCARSRISVNKNLTVTLLIQKEKKNLIELDRWPTAQTTTSTPAAFPSRLRDKLSDIQVLSAADRDTWALTPKTCPKCENPEMKFRDVQLRGADEGSTIFYRCPACDYRYVAKES